jgi:hypothetical protein
MWFCQAEYLLDASPYDIIAENDGLRQWQLWELEARSRSQPRTVET